MSASVPRRSLITRLRGSSSLAAVVLALFLSSVLSTAICAAHDLADAGIGAQDGQHLSASGDSGTGPDSGGSNTADGAGHCCHSGGHHSPALLVTTSDFSLDSQIGVAPANHMPWPSALDQRELRPPIL